MPPTSVSLQTHSSHSLPFNFFFLLAKWQMRVWKDLPADHLTKWNATRNATGSNCFFDRFMQGFVLWPLHQASSVSKGPSSGCDTFTARCQMLFLSPPERWSFWLWVSKSPCFFRAKDAKVLSRGEQNSATLMICSTMVLRFWCHLKSRPLLMLLVFLVLSFAQTEDLDPLRDERVAVGEYSSGPMWHTNLDKNVSTCVNITSDRWFEC